MMVLAWGLIGCLIGALLWTIAYKAGYGNGVYDTRIEERILRQPCGVCGAPRGTPCDLALHA